MKHDNYLYHVEMMLSEMSNKAPSGGDTRAYLSMDRSDIQIIKHLLEQELRSRQFILGLRGELAQS